MTGIAKVTIKNNNIQVVLGGMEEEVKKALTECGLKAEKYAIKLCPYDTGLLRNSITYAVSGEEPAIKEYKADKSDEKGKYEGTAPEDKGSKYTVYIGTNVEYASAVELGIGQKAQPYIKPAIEDHTGTYQSTIKKYLEGNG